MNWRHGDLNVGLKYSNKFVPTKMRLKLGTKIDLSERFVRFIRLICQIDLSDLSDFVFQ